MPCEKALGKRLWSAREAGQRPAAAVSASHGEIPTDTSEISCPKKERKVLDRARLTTATPTARPLESNAPEVTVVTLLGEGKWWYAEAGQDGVFQWIPFPLGANTEIEEQLKRGESVGHFSNGDEAYKVYFDGFIQRNISTNWLRRVLRVSTADHLVLRDADCSAPVEQTTDAMMVPLTPAFPLTPFEIAIPENWTAGQHQNCVVYQLQEGVDSRELERIKNRLTETGVDTDRCIGVARIQNKSLWAKFSMEKRLMEHKNNGVSNEKFLFHGTRAVPPAHIYDSEEGFDIRFCCSGKWGIGCYFAERADYSECFAHRNSEGAVEILIAKVITGFSHTAINGNSSLRLPPAKKGLFANSEIHKSRVGSSRDRYDSVVGLSGRSDIYTVYNNSHAYPAYVITLRTVQAASVPM